MIVAGVLAILVIGGLYLASQSPTVADSLGSLGGGAEPGRDYTGQDWAAGIAAGGSAIGDVLTGVGNLYSGGGASGAMAAAGGTSKAGTK